MKSFSLRTGGKSEFVDITDRVRQAVAESGVKDGLAVVFVPHTTAGVTINENADPDVKRDMLKHFDRLVPEGAGYVHDEGNSPGHIKSSIVGSSVTVIVSGGRLVLGTWQAVYFCEFDGPRSRTVHVEVR